MDQKVRAKTRERKLSNTLESKERRAWPKPQCPWMMPRRHSSFQTADATDFSEQVPHGSSSIKVAFVIMRNLWAQVLESRDIYLCLGAGWSTTQVWPLRRDWGGAERRGTTQQIMEPRTALEPFWRIGQSLVHWCAPLSVYPYLLWRWVSLFLAHSYSTAPASERTGHTLAKGKAAVAERERARETAGSRVQVKASKSGTTVWASPQSRDVRYPQPSVQPCAPPQISLPRPWGAVGDGQGRVVESHGVICTLPHNLAARGTLCPCRYPQYLLPSTPV